MLPVKLVINPAAGKVSTDTFDIKRLLWLLSENSFTPEIVYTKPDHSEREQVLYQLEQKYAIIVVGGDGTLNKIATYMLENNVKVPILLIPGGTANVFYLEKKLTKNLDKAVNILINGKIDACDVGFVEHKKGKNYFLLMIGIGLDAIAVKEIDANVKKILGKATYLFSGVKNLLTFKPRQLDLQYDDKKIENVHSVIISNGRLYGGNIKLFPLARMNDGFLDMCVFTAENNVTLLKDLASLQYSRKLKNDGVIYQKIKTASIQSNSQNKIVFQVDGEAAGYLPIKVGIMPKSLNFFVPKQKTL